MPLLVLYNPICGDKTAKLFVEENVLPLLRNHSKQVDHVVETTSVGHAGVAVADFCAANLDAPITVLVASGDGTLHEIINARTLPKIHFVLVPCGTANALYSSLFPPHPPVDKVDYRLQSLRSYIEGGATLPMSMAVTVMSAPADKAQPDVIVVAAVVVSTSLHASILNDSECLREEHPGVERFKMAAQKNSTRWYDGHVKLFPSSSTGVIQIYDPATQSFIVHPGSTVDDPNVNVDGPFSYFLSTVNVDRLEPFFRITPLARTIPSSGNTCEIIIVRPLRDPAISRDSTEERTAFAQKLWTVLGEAYQDGSHINLRYNHFGEMGTEGNGPAVVEYVRCGGWEWIPDKVDEGAHLICSDGAIWNLLPGGRAVCSATIQDSAGFAIYG